MPSADIESVAPPILDFSTFRDLDSPARTLLIERIRKACISVGFFQITNHGISRSQQEEVLAAVKQFFDLPLSSKMKLDKNKNNYNRGYEAMSTQKLEPSANSDTKESFFIGREVPADHPTVLAGLFNTGPNVWPEELGDAWKRTMSDYYELMFGLAKDLLKALAIGLSLQDDFFAPLETNTVASIRLIHYPPTPTTSEKSRGCGAHRDYGFVTILMQDEVGGLQVQDIATGEWVDVKPVPGAYVINLGNTLMRWTNDKYTSNIHRVMNTSNTDRYSVPFFFNGNQDQVLDCIPGCEDIDDDNVPSSKYPVTTIGKYFKEQFLIAYERAREPDIS